jgi:hypothetical protein
MPHIGYMMGILLDFFFYETGSHYVKPLFNWSQTWNSPTSTFPVLGLQAPIMPSWGIALTKANKALNFILPEKSTALSITLTS